jgi:hypothetical protein
MAYASLEYVGLVVDHTLKGKVWKQVVKDNPHRATLELHLEVSIFGLI